MTFVTLGNGCGGLSACYGFRGVIGTGLETGDGEWTNMYNWLAAFDLTTVAWGILQSNTFSTPDLTEPDNSIFDGVPQNLSNNSAYGMSQWFVVQSDGTPYSGPTGQRCQLYWPAGSTYGIYAVDSWNDYQTAWLACTGIAGACGGNIIDIPMPNSELPSDTSTTGTVPGPPAPTLSWQRMHYVAKPGLTSANIQADYVADLAFGIPANYGANWNVSQACYPTQFPGANDPFDDDIP